MLPTLACAALVVCGIACSDGKAASGGPRFEPGSSTPAARAPAQASKPKDPAPARMFAGTQSVLGQVLRYCKRSSCTDHEPRAPASYLAAPSGTFVVFAVAEAPANAVAEVRVQTKDQPSTVTLNPSTLMVFNFGLGKGNYLVDLVAHWKDAEARWRFGLTVS